VLALRSFRAKEGACLAAAPSEGGPTNHTKHTKRNPLGDRRDARPTLPHACLAEARSADETSDSTDHSVTPAAALEKQIELYRRMTGEQRLQIALELHDLVCEIARSAIQRQYPQASEEEISRLLKNRLALAHGR
jgi:hypothetical protein